MRVEILSPRPDARPASRPLFAWSVPAGFPSPADDHLDRSLDLNELLIHRPAATFFVRAAGDSMTGAGILDGDILVVDRSVTPGDGAIVVAVIDGGFTVKRYRHQRGAPRLEAENPDYDAITFLDGQELIVWGVVTGIVRSL